VLGILELLSSGESFCSQTANTRPLITATVAVRGKNGINSDSAFDFNLIDEESTEIKVVQL
jgi:hypothetical protein